MIFESIERAYEVVCLFDKNYGYDNYLCKSKKKNYILCCISSENLKNICCPILLDILQRGHFTGLVEVFTQGDYLIAVFAEHMLQIRLADYVSDGGEEYLFMNRLDFVYQMLAGLCIQEIPVPIACDLLIEEQIGLKSDGVADGYFHLCNLERYGEFDMTFFCHLLADIWEQIFRFEIKKKPYKELKDFCEMLRQKPYEDYLQIISDFTQLHQIFRKKYEDGILTQAHGIRAFWEKLKGAVGILKVVVVVLIIVAALAFLLWSLRDTKKHTGGIYPEIGDVKVKEYVEDQ